MGLLNKVPKQEKGEKTILQMVNMTSDSYYSWNGKLYENDIVRACIRPKVKAIGKLVGKHLAVDQKTGEMKVNPDAVYRFLLSEPNPYMTMQQFLEKVGNQLCLNNNAFILITRDENMIPTQIYPIPCVTVKAVYINDVLHYEFRYRNGKSNTFPFSEIIHLRADYNDSDLFGSSPAQAMTQLMNVVGTIDQGIIKAIRNSSVIKWLLKFTQSMRPEDVKENVKNFVNNYLSVDSETWGAAGVDAKADAIRIEPKDFVPNSMIQKESINRIYSFFNTNEQIVQSKWNEDEWNAYYEAEVEPVAIQLGDTFTIKLFSRRERGFQNRIVFEASNLSCASIKTKLLFQAMVDRGAMTPNEWRATMNMAPVPDGDKPLRRLDTEVVNMVETLMNRMNTRNYKEVCMTIRSLIEASSERSGTNGEAQD